MLTTSYQDELSDCHSSVVTPILASIACKNRIQTLLPCLWKPKGETHE